MQVEGMEVKLLYVVETQDRNQELFLDTYYGKTGRVILQFNNCILYEKTRKFLRVDTYITFVAFVQALCRRSPDSRAKMCELSVFNRAETAPVRSVETTASTSLLAETTTA